MTLTVRADGACCEPACREGLGRRAAGFRWAGPAGRNYGIHSTIKDDLAAEKFFTETGSYLLILQAHSHLMQLPIAARTLRPRAFH
ncbi:hypothetical protein [Nocardia sp. CA-119907]|uniref:hypothetical protein n=1 Tax=Nocardia sp. CA-119907 TaxID=3239973 RepID=UPI003D954B43